MTKEFEIGLNLIRSSSEQLKTITSAQDKTLIKNVVRSIINPITASAYQIKVGDGPKKEELLQGLFALVKLMRDMDDVEQLKTKTKELLDLFDTLEAELKAEKKDGTTG